jgi:hypothetical protein
MPMVTVKHDPVVSK